MSFGSPRESLAMVKPAPVRQQLGKPNRTIGRAQARESHIPEWLLKQKHQKVINRWVG